MPRLGAFPGSFNPLTVAHLAIAEAAVLQCGLGRIDFVVSHRALAKEHIERPRLADRLHVLEQAAANPLRAWLGVVVTDHQLLADIAEGYDVIVLGADKWTQLLDPAFYGGSIDARDAALSRLPEVAVAPRPPHDPPDHARVLDLPIHLQAASSSAVRDGRREWISAEAAAFDDETGAWSAPAQYETWLAAQP